MLLKPEQSIWQPMTLPEFLDSIDESMFWLLPGLVQEEGIVLIDGPRKRGRKSLWAFYLALYLTSQLQKKGLIVEAEGSRVGTKLRLLRLCNGLGLDYKSLTSLLFSHREGIRLDQPGWTEKIIDCIERNDLDFIVLDAFKYFFVGDESKSQDTQAPLNAIKHIRDSTGAAVLFVHHSIKSVGPDTDIDDASRGSSTITDLYDDHHAMVWSKKLGTRMVVRHRDAGEAEFTMDWEFKPDSYVLTRRRVDFEGQVEDALQHIAPVKGQLYHKSTLLPDHLREIKDDIINKLLDEGIFAEHKKGVYICLK